MAKLWSAGEPLGTEKPQVSGSVFQTIYLIEEQRASPAGKVPRKSQNLSCSPMALVMHLLQVRLSYFSVPARTSMGTATHWCWSDSHPPLGVGAGTNPEQQQA